MTDVVLIGLPVRVACAAFRHTFRLEGEHHLATCLLFLMFSGVFLIAESAFRLKWFYQSFVAMGELILAYAVPLAACLAAKLKKQS